MGAKVTIRIEKSLIDEARKRHPEFNGISDTDVVRIILRKSLEVTKTERH